MPERPISRGKCSASVGQFLARRLSVFRSLTAFGLRVECPCGIERTRRHSPSAATVESVSVVSESHACRHCTLGDRSRAEVLFELEGKSGLALDYQNGFASDDQRPKSSRGHA